MITNKSSPLLVLLFVFVLLASCSSGDDEAGSGANSESGSSGAATGAANLESIDIRILESFPVQVNVVVEGSLPDNCTSIQNIDQVRDRNDFKVVITTARTSEDNCLVQPVPLEESIALDVNGLEAGIYTVDVNGLKGTFTLQTDNVIDQSNAVLGGQIWHDLCEVTGAVEADDPDSTAGCVVAADGSYLANGLLESGEPGLAGLVVNLGEGECPASGLASTVTDSEGIYLFSGLTGGTYCVSVDTLDEQNASILLPGEWTFPATVTEGGAAITLASGTSETAFDFGWDYELLPAGDEDGSGTTVSDCIDEATFVADVTVADGTVYSSGESFTKTWRLFNDGTCTWGPGYGLVFVDGDRMEAPESVPIQSEVAPGETIDLSVAMVAPAAAGDYQGNWKLRSASGLSFGIGENADTAFWVQIVVSN